MSSKRATRQVKRQPKRSTVHNDRSEDTPLVPQEVAKKVRTLRNTFTACFYQSRKNIAIVQTALEYNAHLIRQLADTSCLPQKRNTLLNQLYENLTYLQSSAEEARKQGNIVDNVVFNGLAKNYNNLKAVGKLDEYPNAQMKLMKKEQLEDVIEIDKRKLRHI